MGSELKLICGDLLWSSNQKRGHYSYVINEVLNQTHLSFSSVCLKTLSVVISPVPACTGETDILGSWQHPNNCSLIQVTAIMSHDRCDNSLANWFPMTSASWYSQPCIITSHMVSGLVCLTSRMSLPWLSYKRNCCFSCITWFERASCHVVRKTKQLLENSLEPLEPLELFRVSSFQSTNPIIRTTHW